MLILFLASHEQSLHLMDRRVTFAFVNVIAVSLLELRLELSFGLVTDGTSERSEVNSYISKRGKFVSSHSGANISVLWEKSRNMSLQNCFCNVPGFLLESGRVDLLIQRVGSLEH